MCGSRADEGVDVNRPLSNENSQEQVAESLFKVEARTLWCK